MQFLRQLEAFPPQWTGGAASIGNFDGVHRGHAQLVERLKKQAERLPPPTNQPTAATIVFTFDPHPARILRPEAAPLPLTWPERKAELLGELGVDMMLAYPTDASLLQLTAEEFFQQIICEKLQAKAIVEGPNFYFGRGRGGDVQTLGEFCRRKGIVLEVVEPLADQEQYISSSRIRRLLSAGDVETAVELLGRPHRVFGEVVQGAGRGASLGFPTANLQPVEILYPALGVYAGSALLADGARYPAAVNLGPNPTFGEHAIKLEIHLLGFSGSLYGQRLELDFLRKLRDIHPFASVEALQEQLQRDLQATRAAFDSSFLSGGSS